MKVILAKSKKTGRLHQLRLAERHQGKSSEMGRFILTSVKWLTNMITDAEVVIVPSVYHCWIQTSWRQTFNGLSQGTAGQRDILYAAMGPDY